jgi:hypothetical protein
MKKSHFFSGIAVGLLLGFVIFNVPTIHSATSGAITSLNSESNPIKGEWITAETANQRINGYSTTTTIGGFVGKKNLRDVVGRTGDGYMKYRFYTIEGTTDQVGIIFYPSENCDNMLATGAGSYCPVLCKYPEN